MITDFDALANDLKRDEGVRQFVYDDATGLPLKSGDTIKGNPTIGVGRNLINNGVSSTEIDAMLSNNMQYLDASLAANFTWYRNLDDVRSRAILNMAFNLGVGGLSTFTTFIAFMASGDYARAADDLVGTAWYKQLPARARRIAALIRDGIDDTGQA